MDQYFAPLHADAEVPPASRLERACVWIPVAGWIVSATLWERRHRPRGKRVCQQLAQRPQWPASAWGTDPQRQRVAREVSQSIQYEFDWPNFHFLPEDRLDILLGSWALYQEVLPIFWDIEKRLGVKVEEDVSLLRLSLGEWVDRLAAKVCAQAQPAGQAAPGRPHGLRKRP